MTLLLLTLLAQSPIYIRNDGGYVGKALDGVDCYGVTCSQSGSRLRISGGGSSGASFPTPPVCNDGGVALGWDGGAFSCSGIAATPSPSWAEVTLSAAQSTSLSVGHHVRFDVTRMDGGSLIFPDLATTYTTTNNVASLGRVRVLAGHVYRLMFFHGYSDFPGGGYAHFTMWDTTANVAIGQSVQIQSDSTTYGNWGGGYLHSYYQPSVDSWIEVRITAGGPNSIGVVSTGNHFPTWLIESIN